MTAAIWVAGAVILVAAALLPLATAARRRRSAAAIGRDRAEALLSRLDLAIDRAGAGSPESAGRGGASGSDAREGVSGADAREGASGADARDRVSEAEVREAERCRTLAGGALAGRPTAADTTRARRWAEAGLRALRVTGPTDGG